MGSTQQPWARDRFATARVAHLGTVTPRGGPHLVPVVFVLEEANDVIWLAVDSKPKSTRALSRLANIAANPRVALIVDHYEEDWSMLWWVRADGSAEVVDPAEPAAARGLDALVRKYPAYAAERPVGPVIKVVVDTWRAWSAR
jgi:PPOX class probable F420-dependent enzyme